MELALQIAAASGATVATGKRAFYEQIEQPEREAYERMQRVMAANALDEDAQEGICAFLEKRKPLWRALVAPAVERNARCASTGPVCGFPYAKLGWVEHGEGGIVRAGVVRDEHRHRSGEYSSRCRLRTFGMSVTWLEVR